MSPLSLPASVSLHFFRCLDVDMGRIQCIRRLLANVISFSTYTT